MPVEPITLMLQELAAGDKSAFDRLLPFVYSELRNLARRHLRRERVGHTLQPTALVHEAYTRMMGDSQPDYRSRIHFLSIAARVMRNVLIDYARIRKAEKRGGGELWHLEEGMSAAAEPPASIIAVNDALQALEQMNAQRARLVEMRFFGGLTAEESATVLGLPVGKVRSELRVAQAWLRRELDNKKNT